MSSNVNLLRDLEIDFSIEDIKDSINNVVKIGAYTILSNNEVFNTYRIGKLDGLEMVSMNLSLKRIDDKKTAIHIDVNERLRNGGHEIIVNRVIDNFLDRLAKSLTGQSEEEIKKPANGGCFGVVLLFAIATGALSYFLY